MARIFCQTKAYRDINLFTFTDLTEEQATALQALLSPFQRDETKGEK